MNDTLNTAKNLTIAYSTMDYPKVHIDGCRAATRSVHGYEPDVVPSTLSAHDLAHTYLDNPDEGHFKICACVVKANPDLKPHIKNRKS